MPTLASSSDDEGTGGSGSESREGGEDADSGSDLGGAEHTKAAKDHSKGGASHSSKDPHSSKEGSKGRKAEDPSAKRARTAAKGHKGAERAGGGAAAHAETASTLRPAWAASSDDESLQVERVAGAHAETSHAEIAKAQAMAKAGGSGAEGGGAQGAWQQTAAEGGKTGRQPTNGVEARRAALAALTARR